MENSVIVHQCVYVYTAVSLILGQELFCNRAKQNYVIECMALLYGLML